MIRPSPAELETILNRITVPESRIVAFMVPTRIIRVLQVDPAGSTFRVEQLVVVPGGGEWRALSTHANAKDPWAAYGVAMDAATKAQQDLVRVLKEKIATRQKLLPGLGAPL
jgi:hypothetical protein